MTTLRELVKQILGLNLNKSQVDSFDYYAKELVTYNQHSNLTRILEKQQIIIQHFVDSLSCLLAIHKKSIKTDSPNIVDIGSGAGFPGIPLAIVNPHYKFTLIE